MIYDYMFKKILALHSKLQAMEETKQALLEQIHTMERFYPKRSKNDVSNR